MRVDSTVSFPPLTPALGSTGAAAANVAAMQAALNAGGKVRFAGAGTAWINAPLVIGSNTDLEVDPNLEIKQLASCSGNLLQSAAYKRAWVSAGVSIAWSSGLLATLTWPAHGQSAGGYVWLRGKNVPFTATTSNASNLLSSTSLNPVTAGVVAGMLAIGAGIPAGTTVSGDSSTTVTLSVNATVSASGVQIYAVTDQAFFDICRIISVTDANTVVVELNRVPLVAPAGAMQVKQADSNIRVSGGLWNYNLTGGAGGGPTVSSDLHAVLLAGVQDLDVDVRVKDAAKFCLCVAGVRDFTLKLDAPSSGSDGLKLYGPARAGKVLRVASYGLDDCISLHPEEDLAYASYDFAGGGDVTDVSVEGIDSYTNGGNGLVLYCHPVFLLDNISADRLCSWAASNRPMVMIKSLTGVGLFGRVKLSNLRAADSTASFNGTVYLGGVITGDLLEIDGLSWPQTTPSSGNQAALAIDVGVTLNLVKLRGMRGVCPGSDAGLVQIGGTVKELIVEECSLAPSSSGSLFVTTGSGASVSKIALRRCQTGNFSNLVYVQAGTLGSPYVILEENAGNPAAGVQFAASGSASVSRNNFTGLGNGLVRANGASVVVSIWDHGGNVVPAGKYLSKVNGGETISVFGQNFQCDVTTLARTAGGCCYNTNAAAGSLGVVGVVDCDATGSANSWHLRTNPASATY